MVHVNNEDENYMYQIFSIQTSNTACESVPDLNISRSLVDVLYVFSVTGFHLRTVVSPSLQIDKKQNQLHFGLLVT